MASEKIFLMWSIAEAWDWLIQIPVLGFAMLVAMPFVLIILALYLIALWGAMFE